MPVSDDSSLYEPGKLNSFILRYQDWMKWKWHPKIMVCGHILNTALSIAFSKSTVTLKGKIT
jgi:hypothetical protein